MSTPGRLFFQAIIFITPYCYLSSEFSKLIVLFPCSSEASFSTSDSYVFLSFAIEWCSETYVFALFMRRVRSDGVLSSSLERLTNSYETKTQIILTNHNYDNLSVQCSAQIRTDRFRRTDLQRISLVLTSRSKLIYFGVIINLQLQWRIQPDLQIRGWGGGVIYTLR